MEPDYWEDQAPTVGLLGGPVAPSAPPPSSYSTELCTKCDSYMMVCFVLVVHTFGS